MASDNTPGGGIEWPDESGNGFWENLWGALGGWFSSLGEFIVTGISSPINDVFRVISDWFAGFGKMISDIMDALFNPSNGLEGEYNFADNIKAKLPFIYQFETMGKNIATTGQPLSFKATLGSWDIDINLNWFEPYRGKLRSGLSTVFWVACAMACWRSISSAFGIAIGTAAAMDMASPSNGGKK